MASVARRVVPGTEQSLTTAASGKLGPLAGADELYGSVQAKGAPEYFAHRKDLFDKLYERQRNEIQLKPKSPIQITLPDGSSKDGIKYETSPYDLALSISKGLAESVIVAKVTYTDIDSSKTAVVCADVEEEEIEGEEDGCCKSREPEGPKAELWDLKRPLEGNCQLELLKFESPEAQHVFWHSSAHILGEALELEFRAHLTIGPALERGFYYDAYMGESLKVNEEMYANIEKQAEKICSSGQVFERLVITKEEALEMFKHNPFKVSLISTKVPDGALTTCYRCGSLVDLCRGPHLPTTSKVKAFAVEKHSSAHWLGSVSNDSVQRVYGISFPDVKQMKQYKLMVEEAKKRDHRIVGNALNLFFFETSLSPGCCFWLPDGAKIYNKLCDFIRREYRFRGFSEVISPNIFSCDLFKVSGHYQNYKENMYIFDVESKEWALKPMNCPGHCLIFRHMNPSYRQLPIRMADFGVLHRNEVSGSLTGLTRVRRFQQDDAHIFCRMDQVRSEVQAALEFLFFVYGVFGFKFEMQLSTRPKKALGSKELWTQAEASLAAALDAVGKPWTLNPGDGAFYGPKIDIKLQDALQRWHQCGTVQLDFQLPLRFNLSYRASEPAETKPLDEEMIESGSKTPAINGTTTVPPVTNVSNPVAPTTSSLPAAESSLATSWEAELKPNHARPVMVHRAILGSVERMTAVLVEHTGGKFPFWLSPRQLLVCPISEKNLEYAKFVAKIFHDRGYEVQVDESNSTINKKIKMAQMERWNYVLVVGQQEQESNNVTVRTRDDHKNQVQMTIPDLLEMLKKEAMPTSCVQSEIPLFKAKAESNV